MPDFPPLRESLVRLNHARAVTGSCFGRDGVPRRLIAGKGDAVDINISTSEPDCTRTHERTYGANTVAGSKHGLADVSRNGVRGVEVQMLVVALVSVGEGRRPRGSGSEGRQGGTTGWWQGDVGDIVGLHAR